MGETKARAPKTRNPWGDHWRDQGNSPENMKIHVGEDGTDPENNFKNKKIMVRGVHERPQQQPQTPNINIGKEPKLANGPRHPFKIMAPSIQKKQMALGILGKMWPEGA